MTTSSDELVSTVMGEGYRSYSPPLATSYVRYEAIYETYWVPPIDGVPGEPATPPTPAQIRKIKNEGWNSGARSISQLHTGEYFIYTVMNGVSGAYLGIGPAGLDGRGLTSFTHAILCDRSGVHIFEDGLEVELLTNKQLAASKLRIYRHEDGSIVFVATTVHETLVYTSSKRYSILTPSFIYGLLYASGDRVLTADIREGEVLYASI